MDIAGPVLRILLLATVAAAGLLAPARAALPQPAAPAVQPEGVNAIHETSATLTATVSPMGLTTAYLFQWGRTPQYEAYSKLVLIEDRTMPLRVKHELTGLQAGTRYHWRVVSANALGHAFSVDRSFTTDGARDGTEGSGTGGGSRQGSEDPAEPTPPPQRSSSAVVTKSAGKVRIRKKGGDEFETLEGAALVPFGTVIDARHGRVKLVTEIDLAGTTQTATFKRGMFELRQPDAGDGTVDVILRGGDFARRCGSTLARASRLPSRDRRVVRRLWGSDRHGRFRMHGRNSVATVRGTRWEMIDRCDGTLTRVFSGAVDVRDRRTGRTVRVRPGRPHLSRR